MVGAIGSGLSALNAFQLKMDAAAENVANTSTPGYKAAKVNLKGDANSGVLAEVTRDQSQGPMALAGTDGNTSVELSNVDLAGEMVGMMEAQRGFEANIKVIKTADEMLGALLDIKR